MNFEYFLELMPDLYKKDSEKNNILDNSENKRILESLKNLLLEGDSDSLDLVKILKQSIFNSKYRESILELEKQIRNYDFEDALKTMDKLFP